MVLHFSSSEERVGVSPSTEDEDVVVGVFRGLPLL